MINPSQGPIGRQPIGNTMETMEDFLELGMKWSSQGIDTKPLQEAIGRGECLPTREAAEAWMANHLAGQQPQPPIGGPGFPTPDLDLPIPMPEVTNPGLQDLIPQQPTVGRNTDNWASTIGNQLNKEWDGPLSKTLQKFIKGTNPQNAHELDALIQKLGAGGKLDDLAKELIVAKRDAKHLKNAQKNNDLERLNDAIAYLGSPETKKLWAQAKETINKVPSNVKNDATLAGKEVLSELTQALDQKKRPFLEAQARDLIRSFPSGKGKVKPDYAAKKLQTFLAAASRDGKLDDFVRELRGSKHGQKQLAKLEGLINKHGGKTGNAAWDAAKLTTKGQKPKLPAPPPKKPAAPAPKPPTAQTKPANRPAASRPAAQTKPAAKPAPKPAPKPVAQTKPKPAKAK